MDKFEQHIKRMKGLRDVYEVGTGQHNILSMLINECEAALRIHDVIKSVCDCSSETFAHHYKGGDKCGYCGGKAES
jgi:redox-regulated HSP33 family molecular chaperone